ncbi:unnamed protein product [Spirodela intermedia]|uniref:Uncharacterized protein n=1 Tax=Spirodela intermedia TaxID=51605 RepID=A0A7I8JVU8_SPIIN|nr:unnamed protein product [Spirodela intermedia]
MARFCGAGSFSHEEEDDLWPPPGKKPTRRRHGGGNPYAGRGLEQFTMVLAELEVRREKIMAMAGEQGVSFVRFMYSNSQDWVPIVVRRRPPPPPPTQKGCDAAETGEKGSALPGGGGEVVAVAPRGTAGNGGCGGFLAAVRWRDSCYYWSAVAVMILLCLAMSGRVLAICCTAAWWYVAPPAVTAAGERRKPVKEYGTRMNDRRLGGVGGGGHYKAAVVDQEKRVGPAEVLPSPRPGRRG